MDEMRIDKWLWAARFFKTRSAAQEEVSLGRVLVDGSRAKPSRSIRPGNLLEIRRGEEVFKVVCRRSFQHTWSGRGCTKVISRNARKQNDA